MPLLASIDIGRYPFFPTLVAASYISMSACRSINIERFMIALSTFPLKLLPNYFFQSMTKYDGDPNANNIIGLWFFLILKSIFYIADYIHILSIYHTE